MFPKMLAHLVLFTAIFRINAYNIPTTKPTNQIEMTSTHTQTTSSAKQELILSPTVSPTVSSLLLEETLHHTPIDDTTTDDTTTDDTTKLILRKLPLPTTQIITDRLYERLYQPHQQDNASNNVSNKPTPHRQRSKRTTYKKTPSSKKINSMNIMDRIQLQVSASPYPPSPNPYSPLVTPPGPASLYPKHLNVLNLLHPHHPLQSLHSQRGEINPT